MVQEHSESEDEKGSRRHEDNLSDTETTDYTDTSADGSTGIEWSEVQSDNTSVSTGDESTEISDDDDSSVFMIVDRESFFREEGERKYIAFGKHRYPLAIDDFTEEAAYCVKLEARGGNLKLDSTENVRHVLDIGTGNGKWAIDFCDANEGIFVDGIDLGPMQPTTIHPNVNFYIEDVEDGLILGHYDMVHLGDTLPFLHNRKRVLRETFRVLNSGGWVLIEDLNYSLILPRYRAGFLKLGVDLFAVEDALEELRDVGFIDVERRDIPITGKHKAACMGLLQMRLEAWSIGPRIENTDWTPEDAASFIQSVVNDLEGPKRSAFDSIDSQEAGLWLSVVSGRRP